MNVEQTSELGAAPHPQESPERKTDAGTPGVLRVHSHYAQMLPDLLTDLLRWILLLLAILAALR